MATHSNEDIYKTLSLHQNQLTVLSSEVGGMKVSLEAQSLSLRDHGNTLNQIRDHLTRASANKPVDFSTMLSYARDSFILMGLIVSGIIYIAGTNVATEIALMKAKDDSLAKATLANTGRLGELEKTVSASWPTVVSKRH
jgi:hypothetical protein